MKRVFLICIFLWSIGLQAASPRSSQCAQIFIPQEITYFANLKRDHKVPASSTENSGHYLFDAIGSILQKFRWQWEDSLPKGSFRFQKNQLFLSRADFSKDPAVVGAHVYAAVVSEALKTSGLSESSRAILAERGRIIILSALGRSHAKQDKVTFLKAVSEITTLVQVSQEFQIPYLAGYSQRGARWIYLDRDLDPLMKLAGGRVVDTRPFLIVHEFMEKSFLDFLQLTEAPYLRTHQLAQRFEKEAVRAADVPWTQYQHEKMRFEIKRAEEQKISISPDDLDQTPYLEFKDNELLKTMKQHERAGLTSLPSGSKDFDVEVIRPQVFYLRFKDQKVMASTMLRFQEYYESPYFRGKYFSREEFKEWYIKKNGIFDYIEKWDGFNFPNHVLNAFYKGKFPGLTPQEKEILNFFKNRRHQSFYIIAIAEDAKPSLLTHEIAHSLYYLNSAYKTEITAVMKPYNLEPLKKHLYEVVGDYHQAVLTDEAHAWLMNDSADLIKEGFNIEPYKELITALQNIYKKYTN